MDLFGTAGVTGITVLCYLLGLALRKPLEKFMKLYVSKVEESKMME